VTLIIAIRHDGEAVGAHQRGMPRYWRAPFDDHPLSFMKIASDKRKLALMPLRLLSHAFEHAFAEKTGQFGKHTNLVSALPRVSSRRLEAPLA
jgi:hypothetical protein